MCWYINLKMLPRVVHPFQRVTSCASLKATFFAVTGRVPSPVSPSNNTDNLDANKLAEFAMSGLLNPIAIPTVEELKAMNVPCHETLDSLLREMDFLIYEQYNLDEQIVATNFLAEVFRPERFSRSKEVTAYLELATMISQSESGKARKLAIKM